MTDSQHPLDTCGGRRRGRTTRRRQSARTIGHRYDLVIPAYRERLHPWRLRRADCERRCPPPSDERCPAAAAARAHAYRRTAARQALRACHASRRSAEPPPTRLPVIAADYSATPTRSAPSRSRPPACTAPGPAPHSACTSRDAVAPPQRRRRSRKRSVATPPAPAVRTFPDLSRYRIGHRPSCVAPASPLPQTSMLDGRTLVPRTPPFRHLRTSLRTNPPRDFANTSHIDAVAALTRAPVAR
jgi:hypothetical protein